MFPATFAVTCAVVVSSSPTPLPASQISIIIVLDAASRFKRNEPAWPFSFCERIGYHGSMGTWIDDVNPSPEVPARLAELDGEWKATDRRIAAESDPDKIGAVGGSAGGQLAALLGTSGDVTELEGTGGHGGYSSRVNLVIVFNGMFDLVELHEHSILRGDLQMAGIVEAYVGGTPGQSPLAYEAASAITHVDGLDPPALLLHGTSDELVPFEQSLRFKEALEDAGVPVELFVAEGATHGFFNNPPYFQETLERMEEFIAKHFKSD